jgi:hypothetical protein
MYYNKITSEMYSVRAHLFKRRVVKFSYYGTKGKRTENG